MDTGAEFSVVAVAGEVVALAVVAVDHLQVERVVDDGDKIRLMFYNKLSQQSIEKAWSYYVSFL